jgi:hypothetical protein
MFYYGQNLEQASSQVSANITGSFTALSTLGTSPFRVVKRIHPLFTSRPQVLYF